MHTFARVNIAMWWRSGRVHERVPCSFISQLANENRHTVSKDSVPCSFLKNNLYFSVVLYFTVDKYSPLNLIFICYFVFFLNLAFTVFKLWVWVYTLISWWACGGQLQPLVLVIAFCGFETGSHCSLLAHEPMESSCLCLPSSWSSLVREYMYVTEPVLPWVQEIWTHVLTLEPFLWSSFYFNPFSHITYISSSWGYTKSGFFTKESWFLKKNNEPIKYFK